MDIIAITQQMLILFLILLVGYGASKLGYMNPAFNKAFSGFVINVSTPALILYSVMGSERSLSDLEVLLLLGLSVLTYALIVLASFLIPKLFRAKGSDAALLRFMFIFSNSGFMGFPVVSALFGESAVFYAAIFGMPFNLLVYSYGVRLASGGTAGGFDKKTLLSPCILASVAALLLYFIKIPFPSILTRSVGYISQITVPGAMLILGASLAAIPLKSVFNDARIYGLTVLKLLVVPVLFWLLLRPFLHSELMLGVIVVMWAVPVATNCTMLAAQYDGDVALASKGVFITTLCSMVTIPLLMWFLFVR